jgi:uncharacterized membrane protein
MKTQRLRLIIIIAIIIAILLIVGGLIFEGLSASNIIDSVLLIIAIFIFASRLSEMRKKENNADGSNIKK